MEVARCLLLLLDSILAYLHNSVDKKTSKKTPQTQLDVEIHIFVFQNLICEKKSMSVDQKSGSVAVDPLFRLSYVPIKWLMEQPADAIVNKEYIVKGHIRFVRAQSKVTFIHMYDGSSPATLQLVLDHVEQKELYARVAKDLNIAATISVKGELKSSLKKQNQQYDLIVSDLTVIGKVRDPSTFLPSIPGVSLETWRKHPDLRVHAPVIQCIFRIRSLLMQALQQFFDRHNVHRLDPNTITRADCEGAGEQFVCTSFDTLKSLPTKTSSAAAKEIDWRKDFFQVDGPARLTVSSQLQLEALVHAMGACWTGNPSYRAEPSKTTRHVASFTHIEWEIPFIDLKDLMDFSEDLVQHCCNFALTRGAKDLEILNATISPGLVQKLKGFVSQRFQRITYTEAIEILKAHKEQVLKQFEGKLADIPKWGDDLGSYCERFISETVFKRPTFVFNYPRSLKSFYMMTNPTTAPAAAAAPATPAAATGAASASASAARDAKDERPMAAAAAAGRDAKDHGAAAKDVKDEVLAAMDKDAKSGSGAAPAEDRSTVQGCDLLVPMLGELIGSSIREHNYEALRAEMTRRKMDFGPLQWYLDLRAHATVPTGGAGLGFDRLVQVMCTTSETNIRDVIPFPVAYQESPF
jgi:asparaginyl-tRNA synthetase